MLGFRAFAFGSCLLVFIGEGFRVLWTSGSGLRSILNELLGLSA